MYFIKQIVILALMLMVSLITKAQWTQLGNTINGEFANDHAHEVSLSADGSIIAIGAAWNDGVGNLAGHVRVFKYTSGTWVQMGNDIDGEAAGDYFGISVSLSDDGQTLAVGAKFNDGNATDAGQVRVYHYNGTAWIQVGSDIDGNSTGDCLGWDVSLSADGTIVAAGATQHYTPSPSSGYVKVYQNISGVWTQMGSNINGEAVGDQFGLSVNISEDGLRLAVGARYNDGNGSQSGHVRMFEYTAGNWIQIGNDIDGDAGSQSGSSTSLNANGSEVAIGAPHNAGGGNQRGCVRIYKDSSGIWVQKGNTINGEGDNDCSGWDVSLSKDGNIVAIGAAHNDVSSPPFSHVGHVRVYQYGNGNWIQIMNDIDGDLPEDYFGWSVSLNFDGSVVACGATESGSSSDEAGYVKIYGGIKYSTVDSIACDSLVSPSNNYLWTSSGTYNDTIQSIMGIDSVITINLTIIHSTTSVLNHTACDSLLSPSGNYVWLTSGTYNDTINNSLGCDSIITINLTINNSPVVDLTATNESCTGAEDGFINATINGGSLPYTYLWSNGETTKDIVNIGEGIYTITVTDGNGCESVKSIALIDPLIECDSLSPHILIPNIFSPNADGKNDILYVRGKGVESLLFVIYDRWGEKVFESTSLNNGWDGTYKGKKMDAAVFVYYIQARFVTGEEKSLKGSVTLIR